jgi:hypothetical protein
MPTTNTISDGYVTDEPAIYGSFNYIGAGATLGGPSVGLINHAWLQFANPFAQGAVIPIGALLLSAHDFAPGTPGDFNSSPVLIRAFDEDAAAVPASYADFNARPKTTAQVLATLTASADGDVSTVDVAAILQELADRPGFTGASVVFALERHATSFDFTTFGSIEGGAPAQLRLETTKFPGRARLSRSASSGTLVRPASRGTLRRSPSSGTLVRRF